MSKLPPISEREEDNQSILSKMQANISYLTVATVYVYDSSVGGVITAIEANTNVTDLELVFGELSKKKQVELFDALTNNQTITTLHLTNFFDSQDTEISKRLADLLRNNGTLNTLYLSNLSSYTIGKLANALEDNKTLTTLVLDCCRISPKAATMLSDALRINTNLNHLSLNNSPISIEEAKALAEELAKAIGVNTTLVYLSIDRCNIQDEGAIYLIDALTRNLSLQELSVQYNKISQIYTDNIKRTMKERQVEVAQQSAAADNRWVARESNRAAAEGALDLPQ